MILVPLYFLRTIVGGNVLSLTFQRPVPRFLPKLNPTLARHSRSENSRSSCAPFSYWLCGSVHSTPESRQSRTKNHSVMIQKIALTHPKSKSGDVPVFVEHCEAVAA